MFYEKYDWKQTVEMDGLVHIIYRYIISKVRKVL